MALFLRSDRTTPSRRGASVSSARSRDKSAIRSARLRGRASRRPTRDSLRGSGLALFIVSAVVTSGAVLGAPVAAEAATAYPSWDDVAAAAKNQQKKSAEITTIEKLIAKLKRDVATKQAIAVKRGDELQEAQLRYDQQETVTTQLEAKAQQADRVAKASEVRAAQFAAQLGRSGSNDLSANLLAAPGDAGDLLYKLGAMSKLTEQASGIYATAVQDRNTARSRTAQAAVATQALERLSDQAQAALGSAQAAAVAAHTAVSEQDANQNRLIAQLAAITEQRGLTEAAYNKGVTITRAEEAAAKRAAAAAGATGLTAVPSAQGWTKPAGGYITSGFGMRWDPAVHVYQLHAGTDLGASCGSPILAAHSGKVVYAGPYGGYGNFVLLDNGDSISTGYGHIVNGGILVSVGQTVTVGQQIARVGSTGWSTGCHLHFETRVNTAATDAVPFMAARGVTLQ